MYTQLTFRVGKLYFRYYKFNQNIMNEGEPKITNISSAAEILQRLNLPGGTSSEEAKLRVEIVQLHEQLRDSKLGYDERRKLNQRLEDCRKAAERFETK